MEDKRPLYYPGLSQFDNRMHDEISAANARVAEIQANFAQRESAHVQNMNDLRSKCQQLESLASRESQARAKAENESNRLKEENHVLTARCTEMIQLVRVEKDRAQATENAANTMRSDFDGARAEWQRQFDDVTRDLTTSQQECQGLQNNFNTFRSDVEILMQKDKTEISKLENDIQRCGQCIDEQNSKLAQADADIRAALADRDADQRQIETLKSEIHRIETEDSALLQQYKQTQAEYAAANAGLVGEKEAVIAQLRSASLEFENEKRRMEIEIQSLASKNGNLERDNGLLQAKYVETEQQMQMMQSQLVDKLEGARREIQAAVRENQELTAEFAAVRAQLEMKINDGLATIDISRQEMEALRRECDEHVAARIGLEKDLRETRDIVAVTERRALDAERNCRIAQQQAEDLALKNEELNRLLEALRGEMALKLQDLEAKYARKIADLENSLMEQKVLNQDLRNQIHELNVLSQTQREELANFHRMVKELEMCLQDSQNALREAQETHCRNIQELRLQAKERYDELYMRFEGLLARADELEAQLAVTVTERDALKDRLVQEAARFDQTLTEFQVRYDNDKATWERERVFMVEEFEREQMILKGKIRELTVENETLADKLQGLTREAEQIQRQMQFDITKLVDEVSIEQARRAEAEGMVEKLALELQQLRGEYEAKLAELNSVIVFLKEEIATLKKTYLQQIQNMEIELCEQKALNDRLAEEIEKQGVLYEKQTESLVKQRDDFKMLVAQLKEDLKEKQEELIQLAVSMETEIARLTQEKQNFWIKLQDKTAETRDLKTRMQKLKDRFKAQQAALTASFEKRLGALQKHKDAEIAALEGEIASMQSTIHQLLADKDRLVLEVSEGRSKMGTWQDECVLLREHVAFVGKMWNQLTEQLVNDKAQVEAEFFEMKKVLAFARDTIEVHEVENNKNLSILKNFATQYLD